MFILITHIKKERDAHYKILATIFKLLLKIIKLQHKLLSNKNV